MVPQCYHIKFLKNFQLSEEEMDVMNVPLSKNKELVMNTGTIWISVYYAKEERCVVERRPREMTVVKWEVWSYGGTELWIIRYLPYKWWRRELTKTQVHMILLRTREKRVVDRTGQWNMLQSYGMCGKMPDAQGNCTERTHHVLGRHEE